jgi:hypothetical protein
MLVIDKVVFDSEKNVVTCLVNGVDYCLVFDDGETLCEVIIDGVGNCDYDEELVDSIIKMSVNV